jgi:hypothetical protein
MLNMRVPGLLLLIVSLCSLFFGKTAPRSQSTSREIQQLAKSDRTGIADPFIFVARDPETYSLLRKKVSNLPEQDAKFFESNVVIAAFLGQRPTGGFSVEFTETAANTIQIRELRPPKDRMVKTVLTTPVRVIAVGIDREAGLKLSLDERWQNALQRYRLSEGQLTVTGGFAGITQQRKLAGQLDVMRLDDLATVFFDVEAGEKRGLVDVASGKVDGRKLSLKRVDAFGSSGALDSPFRITGEFSDEARQLSLMLETVNSPHVSDNYSATGTIFAIKN